MKITASLETSKDKLFTTWPSSKFGKNTQLYFIYKNQYIFIINLSYKIMINFRTSCRINI